MRSLISPVMLLSLGIIQALFPYFIISNHVYSSYNVEGMFDSRYLYYWLILYLSFLIGAFSIELIRKKKQYACNVYLKIFNIRRFENLYKTILFIVVGMSIYSAIEFNGIPLLMYDENYMIQDSIAQRVNLPLGYLSIYQVLAYLLSFMNAVFAISLYTQDGEASVKVKVIGLISMVLIFLSSMFFGHFQGVVISMFIMFMIPMVVTNHPYNCYLHIFSIKKHKVFFTIIMIILLIIIMISLFGYTRSARNNNETIFFMDGLNYMYSYLFFPLLNGSHLIENIDFISYNGNPLDLLKGIFPYRVREYLFNIEHLSYHLPEPTAMLGTMASLISSFGGLVASVFFYLLGILSQLLYRSRNITSVAAYAILAWSLFAIHSYNTVLSLNYFIFPVILIYIVNRHVKILYFR